ncbi:MAG TPA: hybrid sensor histidine kinase/response regulator, partial [Aliiroseovarius sp.]|nr:hybrid sensor histidine kinase/response regulator [Aliiroseovarius sp.]
MLHSALTPRPLTKAALVISPRAGYLLAFAGALLVGAWGAKSGLLSLGLLLLGMTFVSLAFLVRFIALRHERMRVQFFRTIESFVENDSAPSFTTDADGQLTFRNNAARERFDNAEGDTLASVLGDLFASPAAVLSRLQNKAQVTGSAREDVVLRRGHMRLSVHQIGGGGFLWRL